MVCRRSPVAMGTEIWRATSAHSVEVVRQNRVLVEHGVVLLNAAGEHHRLGGRQATVDLNAEVNVVPHGLAVLTHGVDGVRHLVCVGLEVWDVARFIEEGRQVTNGGEALLLGVNAALDKLLSRVAHDVVVDAGLVADLAAQQVVDGNAKVLAFDVPQRDVNGGDGAHDGRTTEMRGAVHHVPMVLDQPRVFAHQVLAKLADSGFGGFQMAPGARLTESGDAFVGGNLDEEVAVDGQGFDFGDLHCSIFTSLDPCPTTASC